MLPRRRRSGQRSGRLIPTPRGRARSGTALPCMRPTLRHLTRGPGPWPRFRCSPRSVPSAISPYGWPGRMRRPPWNASICGAWPRRRAVPWSGAGSRGRARLREAERREHARVEALAELTRLLAAALTPETVGEVVADRVRAAVGGADALCLGVISQDHRRLGGITAV